MSAFRFTILTPEATAFDGQVDSIMVPGQGGCFGIMARHEPLIGAVATGILKFLKEREEIFFIVGEGIVEVHGGEATLLTDAAIRAANLGEAEDRLEKYLKTQAKPPASLRTSASR